MLTQHILKEILSYDPETGLFANREWRGGKSNQGSIAGSVRRDGYVKISIDNKAYLAHRLAWLYVFGAFPNEQIDHVNKDRQDNRIKNLRAASDAENKQNLSKTRLNKSGKVGVIWHKAAQKWMSYIHVRNRSVYLGVYDTIEEAATARAAAKAKYHTFHPEDDNVTLSKETPDNRDHNSRDRERV
jgi:hypothetical protein